MLTPGEVKKVFRDCIFKPEKDNPDDRIAVEILGRTMEFHAERLQQHQQEITAMLSELPESFREAGDSFLEACTDKHGRLWAKFQERAEQLLALGVATGHVVIQSHGKTAGAIRSRLPRFKIR